MDITTFAVNNGVGVFFGMLMWWQAQTSINKNTEALNSLKENLVLRRTQ